MKKIWISLLGMLAFSVSEVGAVGPERVTRKRTTTRAREKARPYRSKDIQALLNHTVSPQDKIEVYSLWIDSLKLRIDQADQDRLAGKINDRQYDDFLNQIAREILKISKEAKKLGFDEIAEMWEGLAYQYSRSMGNLQQ